MLKEERITNGYKGARVAGYEPYSPEENQFLIDNYQKMSYAEIGKKLNRSKKSIFTRYKKLVRDGFVESVIEDTRYSLEEDQVIIDNQDKLSFAQVAEVLGRSRDSVKVRAGKLGISYQKIGETSPVVKLSNEDIEFIRDLNELDLSYGEIALKFDVDVSHVRKVCKFETRLYLDKYDYLSACNRQKDSIDIQS